MKPEVKDKTSFTDMSTIFSAEGINDLNMKRSYMHGPL